MFSLFKFYYPIKAECVKWSPLQIHKHGVTYIAAEKPKQNMKVSLGFFMEAF